MILMNKIKYLYQAEEEQIKQVLSVHYFLRNSFENIKTSINAVINSNFQKDNKVFTIKNLTNKKISL